MLWAIDVGNSHYHCGLWDGSFWIDLWTGVSTSESLLSDQRGARATHVAFATVVPALRPVLQNLAKSATGHAAFELKSAAFNGLEIKYSPPESLGADRLANALGALAHVSPPILIVDIGTATTFEAVDRTGAFVGGAILAGAQVALDALVKATAQLPPLKLEGVGPVIGTSTAECLRSGAVYGHAAAIEGIIQRMLLELGSETTVIATGGLAEQFHPLCPAIHRVAPTLTLDGIVSAYQQTLPD